MNLKNNNLSIKHRAKKSGLPLMIAHFRINYKINFTCSVPIYLDSSQVDVEE